MKVKGLGQAKVSQLLAVIEVAKRVLKESIEGKNYIRNKEDVLKYLSLSMKDLKVEFFKVIFLDQSHGILQIEELCKGTVNETVVYPREVVKRALDLNAAAVIFVHNHPSGNPAPSAKDLALTKRLFEACRNIDITPLDHLIVAGNSIERVVFS